MTTPGLESLLVIDNRDDRVEINNLFQKLTPPERYGFLKWAARHSTFPEVDFIPDDPKAGLTADEASHCLLMLSVHYGVDLARMPACLEEVVRRKVLLADLLRLKHSRQ